MASWVEKVRDWPATLLLGEGLRGAGASAVAAALAAVPEGACDAARAVDVDVDADDAGDIRGCNGVEQPVVATTAATTAD